MLTWKETAVCEQSSKVQALANYQIIRRNGAVVPFEPNKIAHAMMKAFMAVHGVLAFAQSICSGWLHGLWRPLKPSKVSAHSGDLVAGMNKPLSVALQQPLAGQQRFFGSTKPDMRNAP